MAVAEHTLTGRSKGQRSRSHGYENGHGRTADSGAVAVVLLLPAWDCMSYDCLGSNSFVVSVLHNMHGGRLLWSVYLAVTTNDNTSIYNRPHDTRKTTFLFNN